MEAMELKEVRLEDEENPKTNKEEGTTKPPHNQEEVTIHHLRTSSHTQSFSTTKPQREVQTTEVTLKEEKETSPVQMR